MIGIAPKFLPGDEGQPLDVIAARLSIVECIHRAGGRPVLLYVDHPAEAVDVIGGLAGMVFPGGGDSDPGLYGDLDRHPALRLVDPAQDASDLALLRAALSVGLPTLAICRGMQSLNIVLGGSLVQHLEPTGVEHWDNVHAISVTEPTSRLAEIMGRVPFTGRSFHRQAVKRLGDELFVTAVAADGCVEAIEHVSAPFVGVQWHPELASSEAPVQLAPFSWLVSQTRAGR